MPHLLLLLLLCIANSIVAQSGKSTLDTLQTRALPIISAGLYAGNFIKHTPKLTNSTGHWLPGAEITLEWQTQGRHNWQRAHRNPKAGLSAIWLQPGDGAHGNIIGVMPHLSIPLLKWRKVGQVFFRVGSGLAYAQQPHNTFDRPIGNALGSHWNNITQFRLGGQLTLAQRYQLGIGAHLTHISNGGFELPNFGMNIPGAYLSLGYGTQKRADNPLFLKKTKKIIGHRWGAALQTSASRIEFIATDGPKYFVWSASLAATYLQHRYNRWYAGLETEYNAGVAAWLYNNTLLGNDQEQANRGARRLGVFVADEFLFGPLGIYLQYSYHVGPAPLNALVVANNYNKLGARYYFGKYLQTHVGVTLKAYKAIAESISLSSGLRF